MSVSTLNSGYKYIESSKSRTPESIIALDNSSTSILLANQNFEGSVDEIFAYSSITCNIFASHAGTLCIKQSQNGTDFDYTKTFPIGVGKAEAHSCTVTARYAKICFENGNADQTAFRMQTTYHMMRQIETSKISANQHIDEDQDVQVVRLSNDIRYDLVSGLFTKRRIERVWGYAKTLKTSFAEMIRDEANGENTGLSALLSTASALRVKTGGNVVDVSPVGSGALSILIKGLDANYNKIEETVLLTGASVSLSTTQTFLRVLSVKVNAVGANKTNEGNINVETITGVLVGQIRAKTGISRRCLYSVEADHTAYIEKLRIQAPADKLVWAELCVREFGSDVTTSHIKFQVQGTNQGYMELDYGIKVEQKSDVWIQAMSEGGVVDNVSCEMALLVIDDTLN